MILITSAAYITQGLITEFGKLPPSMLPIQNKRLYQHQIGIFDKEEEVIISFPKDYDVNIYDKRILIQNNVTLVYVPNDLSLGESIVYVLNVVSKYTEDLKILHGDTLFHDIPSGLDLCIIANVEDDYNWAYTPQNSEKAYAGYFAFSNQSLLIQKITENDYSFIAGVEDYAKSVQFKYINSDSWFDFGIPNAFYRSKSLMTTQRIFNDLKIDRFSVTKYSKDIKKIFAEANWFKTVPISMKKYIPNLWDTGYDKDRGYYRIEYFYLNSLSDLYVYGNNSIYVWYEIINACYKFIEDSFLIKPQNIKDVSLKTRNLFGKKTIQRLNEYAELEKIDINRNWIINNVEVPSLYAIISETDNEIKQDDEFISLMHGDFCFSNILYDFKTKSIKVIDPRGIDTNGCQSIYGDVRYDIAKLAHSIIGLYDYIIGGRFEYYEVGEYNLNLKIEINNNLVEIQKYFLTKKINGLSIYKLKTYPILIHLFLSMLPLHHDCPPRQKAMLANALRLYVEYKKLKK